MQVHFLTSFCTITFVDMACIIMADDITGSKGLMKILHCPGGRPVSKQKLRFMVHMITCYDRYGCIQYSVLQEVGLTNKLYAYALARTLHAKFQVHWCCG